MDYEIELENLAKGSTDHNPNLITISEEQEDTTQKINRTKMERNPGKHLTPIPTINRKKDQEKSIAEDIQRAINRNTTTTNKQQTKSASEHDEPNTRKKKGKKSSKKPELLKTQQK